MPFGPFALQWRTPSPNPPTATPLPPGISRSYIATPAGPLELLSALPQDPSPSNPPLFFAHGGFGCAEVWTEYLQFFASQGYPCYAVSYRGHGRSWYPSLLRLYFTTRGSMASDLVAAITHVEHLEAERRGAKNASVVLVSHSAGGALSQYVLGRGLVRVSAFCMLAAVPGFGSWSVYKFWSWMAPVHFPYRLWHPRYVLADTGQVKRAFFTLDSDVGTVRRLEGLLSPYESMLWPLQCLFRFVSGADVLASIVGWGPRKSSSSSAAAAAASSSSSAALEKGGDAPVGVPDRLLVLAAEHDVLCTPVILQDVASRYRAAFRQAVKDGELQGVAESDLRTEKEQGQYLDGVGFEVVEGLAHHLQNHNGWEKGARQILEWVRRL